MVVEKDQQSTFNAHPVDHGINSRLPRNYATISLVIRGVDLPIIILQPSKGTHGCRSRIPDGECLSM